MRLRNAFHIVPNKKRNSNFKASLQCAGYQVGKRQKPDSRQHRWGYAYAVTVCLATSFSSSRRTNLRSPAVMGSTPLSACIF